MKKILCMAIIVSLLGACQSRPALAPQPTLMLTPVLPVAHLAPANVSNMGELTTLSNNSLGPVAAAAFSRDGQEFLAAYSKEGILRQWRLNDGQLLTTTQISKAEVAAVAFDEQAKHLAMGAGDVAPLTSGDTSATFNGARLWDIESGSMVFESHPMTLPFGQPAY